MRHFGIICSSTYQNVRQQTFDELEYMDKISDAVLARPSHRHCEADAERR